MNGPLSVATTVASLLLAAWCAVSAVRDRPPGRAQLAAMAVVEVLVLALVVAAGAVLAGGERPAETATLVGYLVTIVCVPPIGWLLARLEPTRWGSVILLVTALVVPVLVARLQQVWQAAGG